MQFSLRLLGTGSASPSLQRFTTAQVLSIEEYHFLIDCGEGTQMRMDAYQVKRYKIKQVFISHLHGDHYFGLFGLITSYNLNGRKDRLQIFSPPGLEEVLVPALQYGGAALSFPIEFIEVDPEQSLKVFENAKVEVYTLPLQHRIPTCGYLFRERVRPRSMRSEQIQAYGLSIEQIKAAKLGADIQLENGLLIPNAELTTDPPPARSYAYCSDTSFLPALIPLIQGVDLLYHESTFCQDNLDRAHLTGHSTALEAAQIAHSAGVRQLVLGHYSARYEDVSVFEKEAQTIFPNSIAGEDGAVFEVPLRKSEEE